MIRFLNDDVCAMVKSDRACKMKIWGEHASNLAKERICPDTLHNAYTALLAGLTKKTGNEIHWKDKHEFPITIELIDVKDETFIAREYYENGNLHWKGEYRQGKLHGISTFWHKYGKMCGNIEYCEGEHVYFNNYCIRKENVVRKFYGAISSIVSFLKSIVKQ